MNYGLYLSANGARVQSRRLDVVANNLANAQTAGFKRDLAVFRANHAFDRERSRHPGRPAGLDRHTGGASLAAVVTDHRNGGLQATGGAYDVAVTGPGFLQVGDGRETYLTRDGRMTVSETGQLVSRSSGHAVLDDRGRPIHLVGHPTSVSIADDGTVSQVDQNGDRATVGRIGLFRPRATDELAKVGHGLFATNGRVENAGPEVRLHQGHLEASGTNPIEEMMQMIEATRAFEANTNMIKYQDESLGRLLQSVPRR